MSHPLSEELRKLTPNCCCAHCIGALGRAAEALDEESAHNSELRKVHDSDTETLLEVLRERDELRRQVEMCAKRSRKEVNQFIAACNRAERAEARVAKLTEALQWYGDSWNYAWIDGLPHYTKVLLDNGHRARQALAEDETKLKAAE